MRVAGYLSGGEVSSSGIDPRRRLRRDGPVSDGVRQMTSSQIDGQCSCGGRFHFTLDDVAAQRTVRCSRGHSVKLEDHGGGARKARDAERKLEKSIRDLQRTVRRFGK